MRINDDFIDFFEATLNDVKNFQGIFAGCVVT